MITVKTSWRFGGATSPENKSSVHVVKKWRKFFGVGCSHGEMSCPKALAAVLRFKQEFKPDFTFHLGDAIDCTAFRSGAKGTKDEAAEVPPDVFAGLDFLEKLRPNVFLFGNHEDRLVNLSTHFNAIVSGYAGCILNEIKARMAKQKTAVVGYGYGDHYKLGNFKLIHGTVYTENAARDHAELHGCVIHAHSHRAQMATGRRTDAPVGIAVGCLMDPLKRITRRLENPLTLGHRASFGVSIAIHSLSRGFTFNHRD